MAVVYMVGGAGDMTGAIEDNGGAYNPAEVADWTLAQDANGGNIGVSPSTGTIDDDATYVRVNETGAFGSVVDGVYAYLSASGYTIGRYRVRSHTANSVTLDLAWVGNDTNVLCIVGGAIRDDADADDSITFEIAPDLAAAGDTIKIRNTLTFNTTGYIILDGTNGTPTSHVTVEGVDANGDRDTSTKVLVTMTSNPSYHEMVQLSGNLQYWDFYGLEFDGNSLADVVLYSTGNEHYNNFHDCVFHDPAVNEHVVDFAGNSLHMYNCEVYGATGGSGYHGIANRSQAAVFDSCYIHNNTGDGINNPNGAGYPRIVNCRFEQNGTGITTTIFSWAAYIANCTFENNTSHGLNYTGVSDAYISHCISSNNGGYGFFTNAQGPRCSNFSYNNSYLNSSGDIDVAGTWATMGNGGNLALAPDYDADFFAQNMNLVKGGLADRPIGAGLYKRPAEMVAGSHFSLVGSPMTGGF